MVFNFHRFSLKNSLLLGIHLLVIKETTMRHRRNIDETLVILVQILLIIKVFNVLISESLTIP